MNKTYTLNADGTMTVRAPGGKDANGNDLGAQWDMQPLQIVAHRRDAAIDTDVKAALQPAQLAQLDELGAAVAAAAAAAAAPRKA